jgi:hypothetical protein
MGEEDFIARDREFVVAQFLIRQDFGQRHGAVKQNGGNFQFTIYARGGGWSVGRSEFRLGCFKPGGAP